MGVQTKIRPLLLPAADAEAIAALRRFGSTAALPFVALDGAGAILTRWAPRITRNYVADCEIGRSYGEALVRHIRRHGDTHDFQQVMLDMVKDADPAAHRGVLVGFFGCIGDALLG